MSDLMNHFDSDEQVQTARRKKVESFWRRYRTAKLRCAQTNNAEAARAARDAMIAEGRKHHYFVQGQDHEAAE